MKPIKRLLARIDNWQQSHTIPGFLYALTKKYGEDEAAYQGALITYYGFLSLFPLLIVATSVLQLVLRNNPELRQDIINDVVRYFPIVGDQIREATHGLGKTGVALAVGIVTTFYGTRGAADALQHAFNHIWQVPRSHRPNFPKAPLTSLLIILVGGLGLIAASILSTITAGVDRSAWFKLVPIAVSLAILFALFLFVFKIGVAKKLSWRNLWPGALMAAIGIQLLQAVGGLIITHQLKGLSNLYGTFALVLGIMAWIYLQAQIILYAAEVNTVLTLRLWPRAMDQDALIKQDKRAYRKYAKKERFHKEEKVDVSFANAVKPAVKSQTKRR